MKISSACLLTLTCSTALAQGAWLQQQPNNSPPARSMGAMAAMLQQNKTVLFGGETSNGNLNDTWSWDGSNWTQLNPTTSPQILGGSGVTYDAIRDRIVLFSGWNGGQYVPQTWEFDGVNWTQPPAATQPGGRDWCAMTYDYASNNCIMFGGHDWQLPGGAYGDTWTWDGTTWTALTPTVSPSARYGHAMTFDPIRGKVILFGGGTLGNEMWEWSGTTWTQITPATVPPPRAYASMVTDPVRNRVVMVGGEWSGAPLNDVWEWDGVDWSQNVTAGGPPSGGYLASLAFDPVLGQVVHFGGNTQPARAAASNETWLYTPSAVGLATTVPYGNGCGAVNNYASYYEQFPAATFDLGGAPGAENVIQHLNSGAGYVALPGTPAFFTPVAPDLGLGDDTVSGALPLGFSMTFPGGGPTITDVWVASNGYIWLQASTVSDYTESVSELLSQGPRIALLWQDLRPASGGGTGTIHFDSDPANGVAYVTFMGVEQYNNASALVTVQCALFSNGNYELRYGAESMSTLGTDTPIVGYTPGNGALDPGSIDISTTVPIFTLPDQVIADMSLTSGRPIEGTSMNVNIDNMPAGSIFGVVGLSGGQVFPGIQPIPGLGSCVQLIATIDPIYFLPTGTSHTLSLAIPTGTFTGSVVYAQAIALAPGFNAASVASSNGLIWTIDVN